MNKQCGQCGRRLEDTVVRIEWTRTSTAQASVVSTSERIVPGERLYCRQCWQKDEQGLLQNLDVTPDQKKRLVRAMRGDGFRFWQRGAWRRHLAGVTEDVMERTVALKRRAKEGRPKSGPVWATDAEVERLFIPPCPECGGPPHRRSCKTGARERKSRQRGLVTPNPR
jgi:hypothetical protein